MTTPADTDHQDHVVTSQDHPDRTVCHGVTWATGQPTLLLAEPPDGLRHLPLLGADLGFKICDPGTYCTGRYRFRDTYHVEPLACPDQAPAVRGRQCPACLAADEFRHAHQAHRGGYIPAALRAYLTQPHWLYVATFAAGLTKVGTAALPRAASRLNEQGPIHATYLVRAPDGRSVRLSEDALSDELGITQTVRATTKIAALLQPAPAPTLDEHQAVVDAASRALASWGEHPSPRPWAAPSCTAGLRHTDRRGERAAYPHDLRRGAHRFSIESCLGSLALVRLRGMDDGLRYVLDLAALKGRVIILGDFDPPAVSTQPALF